MAENWAIEYYRCQNCGAITTSQFYDNCPAITPEDKHFTSIGGTDVSYRYFNFPIEYPHEWEKIEPKGD